LWIIYEVYAVLRIFKIIEKIEYDEELTEEEQHIINNLTDEELNELKSAYHMLVDQSR